MSAIDEVVTTLLRFEHRYVPYEGMRRDDLFERVAVDLGMPGLGSKEMLEQALLRVADLVDEAVTNAENAEGADATTSRELVMAATGTSAAVAWCEGFEAGMFHAQRLRAEGAMPNADR